MGRVLVLAGVIAVLCCGASGLRAQDADARCAKCHRQIYESWKRTPMASASGPAVEGFIAADFTHTASGVHYRMTLDHGQVWLSYERPGAPPDRALSGRQLLLYYLGSGRRGRTWIYQREGYWYEIPINWYSKKHLWDMTPHYLEASSMPFTLPVDPGCLHCHASDVQASLPEARNKFNGPPFPHGGITCEACHGDASRHVASGGTEPVLDPAKLTGLRRESICLECHLEGEVAVVKQGQKLGAFRPGENLFDEAVYFEDGREIGAEGRATSQWESLLESACRRASGETMTCTTCHDPHATVAAENRVAYYRARCLTCHAGLASGHHTENPDCTSCHMPRQATEDIAHEQVTDHRIQIPGKPFHRANAGGELVAIGGSTPTVRDEGIAWASLALRGDRDAGEHAMKLLIQAESADPAQASDADLHVNLGFLEQASGDRDRAAAEFQQALKADPWNETAGADLAVLDAREGNFVAALPLLEKVFRDDPGASAAGVDLALAQCHAGDSVGAAKTLRRVLLFAPDDEGALPFEHEIAFILDTAAEYLSRPPRRDDVLSVYVGIRPLVRAAGSDTGKTSALSRDHTIHIDDSGLLTIAGGKWTTYRRMAQDAVDHAITLGRLDDKPCVTQDLRLHAYVENTENGDPLAVYGSDAENIRRLAAESPNLAPPLDPELPPIAAQVVWAVREEMARSVEDVLARRTRALFLRARAALRMAPTVAEMMAHELGRDSAWISSQLESFRQLAAQYTLERTADSI